MPSQVGRVPAAVDSCNTAPVKEASQRLGVAPIHFIRGLSSISWIGMVRFAIAKHLIYLSVKVKVVRDLEIMRIDLLRMRK